MTQLVFVHGVATRSGAAYDQAVANRNTLFREALFQDQDLKIHTPLWGDLIPKIPKEVYDTNGGAGTFSLNVGAAGLGGGLGTGAFGAAAAPTGDTLADVANAKPAAALDALFVELLEAYEQQGADIPTGQIETFKRVTAAMSADEKAAKTHQIAVDGLASLLGNIASDAALTAKLREAGGAANSYSIGSAIGNAVGTITGRIRKIASSVAFDPLADLARPAVGFFLGDVLTYLHYGDLREGIRSKIREALLAAHEARQPGEKMVVIGHSLGGVILADMLYSPGTAGLPADLKVDALLTVGSQPGLFQSLGLYVPPSPMPLPKPGCIGAWFNVYDPIDPLAFRANPIFADVTDLRFDSITGLASAHTTYFKRPQFHARARRRLQETGVIT